MNYARNRYVEFARYRLVILYIPEREGVVVELHVCSRAAVPKRALSRREKKNAMTLKPKLNLLRSSAPGIYYISPYSLPVFSIILRHVLKLISYKSICRGIENECVSSRK